MPDLATPAAGGVTVASDAPPLTSSVSASWMIHRTGPSQPPTAVYAPAGSWLSEPGHVSGSM
jgi:hypothetical protein